MRSVMFNHKERIGRKEEPRMKFKQVAKRDCFKFYFCALCVLCG